MNCNILSQSIKTGFVGIIVLGLNSGCTNQDSTMTEAVAVRPSITVYPIVMAGQPREDVAYTVALLLERGGIENIAVNSNTYNPPADSDFTEQVNAFSSFVRQNPIPTQYALYGAYLGSPNTGVDEIQTILVNSSNGKVAWSECQTPESTAFKKANPKDPMDCTVFLVDRLRGPLALYDPMREDAPKGKMYEYWNKNSLVPSEAEQKQIEQRLTKLQNSNTAAATVLIYPARDGDQWSKACAEKLADRINRAKLMTATVANGQIEFAAQRASNEQIILWSAARSIQEIIQNQNAANNNNNNQPATDYILIADYMTAPVPEYNMVHTFLLEADGDWVIVDYQNSHYDDFNKIKPRTLDEFCDLTIIRLQKYLNK